MALITTLMISPTLAGCGAQPWNGGTTSATSQRESLPQSTASISEAPKLPTPQASATSSPEPVKEPQIGDLVDVKGGKQALMPLDVYMTSMDGLKVIGKARDIAATSCMKSLGFTSWTTNTIRTWSESTYVEADFFDYLDPSTAAQGYPRQFVESETSATIEAGHSPTKMEMSAYHGRSTITPSGRSVPQGGCFGQSVATIQGDHAELPADPRALAVQSRSSAANDSRVRQALLNWRSCVAQKGLSYDSPMTARTDRRWASRPQSQPAGSEEQRVALIDANCQAETNLVAVYKTARIAYEQQLVDSNKEKLIAGIDIFNHWVENAKAIIAKGA